MTAMGHDVSLIRIQDIGNGWLEVRMAVSDRPYGWFEHKSRRDNYRTEDEWIAYLADQAVGLYDSGAIPLN